MSIDQRHDHRYASQTFGFITFAGQRYPIITQDIAQSGLSVEIEASSSAAPALASQVTLAIPAQDAAAQEVQMKAEIRWCKQSKEGKLLLGLHFQP